MSLPVPGLSACVACMLLALSASPALGQTEVGFFGGIVDSSHRLGESSGSTFGLLARRDLTRFFAVEANSAYVRRGFERDDGRELRSHQAEGALLLRARFLSWGMLTPAVLGGVSASQEVACSARGHAGPEGLGPVLCEVFRDRRYDFGQVGGIGIEVAGETWTGYIEFRRIDGIQSHARTRTTARRISGFYLSFTRDPCLC